MSQEHAYGFNDEESIYTCINCGQTKYCHPTPKTADGLKAKYESDLLEIQAACVHEKSTIMEYQFAPGHGTGTWVSICDSCWKVLKNMPANQNIIFPKTDIEPGGRALC